MITCLCISTTVRGVVSIISTTSLLLSLVVHGIRYRSISVAKRCTVEEVVRCFDNDWTDSSMCLRYLIVASFECEKSLHYSITRKVKNAGDGLHTLLHSLQRNRHSLPVKLFTTPTVSPKCLREGQDTIASGYRKAKSPWATYISFPKTRKPTWMWNIRLRKKFKATQS